MRRIFLLGLSLLIAGGCVVGPDYEKPDAHPPAAFRGDETARTNSLGDAPWPELFQDPALQELIRTALTNNYDLRAAVARVEEARSVLAQNRAAYSPQVTYQGAAGVGKNALEGTPFPNSGKAEWWDGVGSVAWEVDLWGRIRRLNESARADLLASEEARRNITISLVANVAGAYFQLLALDGELSIAQDSTNSFGRSLAIFSERLHGGVTSKLETASARAALAAAAAAIPELRRQIAAQENQLHILLSLPPGALERGRAALEGETLPDIPPGLPSALLERRPDVRQAEQLMRSANAMIGVAKANFYPQLSLTGLLGKASPRLSMLTSGAANAWDAAAGLTGPIFEGGLLKAELRQARAQWDEARLQYQSTVLNAFGEVATALAAREQLAQERAEQKVAVAAYQEAVNVAGERYRGGQASYYELLQEQQQLFPAEDALTQTELNQLLATVQLYKALGGGWGGPAR
jgi:outer membrane protein, multidrug efflux system